MNRNAKSRSGAVVSSIDWSTIHSRLAQAADVLQRNASVTPEEKKRILKERAKVLARERKAGVNAGEQIEIVEFILAYERYAIESAWVREVYPLKELTPLPGTPSFVLGIINVRGQIVSVVDLKKFFDLPARGLTDLNKVIIISDGAMEFGVLADAMEGVRRISLGEIQPPVPTLTGLRADYIRGVTAGRLALLDAARLLGDPKMKISQPVET